MLTNALSTLFLASTALALPATRRSDDLPCTQKSLKTTSLQIRDFDYHASYTFSTPAHQIPSGQVSFTLDNPSAGYKANCSASSTRLEDFFYGELDYDCVLPNGTIEDVTFSYSRPSGALGLNQTWSCAEEGSHFYAEASMELDLKCDEKTWKNPDWHEGETYSTRTVTCQHVDAQVPIDAIQATL